MGRIVDREYLVSCLKHCYVEEENNYEVTLGDRIAQIVFHRYEVPSFVRCDKLSKSDRRLEGLGSTDT